MHYLSFHEGKQHGTVEFPAEYYYIEEDHPRYNMPFHWHREWEIMRILQGEFLLLADDEEYLAQEGDVLLIRDGMLHGGTPHNCIYECFVFDLHGLFKDPGTVKNCLRPIYRNLIQPQVLYPGYHRDIYPVVEELMASFSTKAQASEASPLSGEEWKRLMAIGNLSRLFARILKDGCYALQDETSCAASRKVSQVKPVLEYIETHFKDTITLSDLSRVVGMNANYFCRFFHSITHQTPMDYVNYYRIEQACAMLCSTDLTVTQIGMECGFNDSSYFVKAFRKYKGLTPKQYQLANT